MKSKVTHDIRCSLTFFIMFEQSILTSMVTALCFLAPLVPESLKRCFHDMMQGANQMQYTVYCKTKYCSTPWLQTQSVSCLHELLAQQWQCHTNTLSTQWWLRYSKLQLAHIRKRSKWTTLIILCHIYQIHINQEVLAHHEGNFPKLQTIFKSSSKYP